VVSTEGLTIEAKRELIARVAESDLFQKSPRLREFLLYSGDCTLDNRLADVREQVIAEKVFQRKAQDYDAQDSIVRAEARNLRKRLEKYFETEGWLEKYLITMPKGGYALSFEPRPGRSSPGLESVPLNILDNLPDSQSKPAHPKKRALWPTIFWASLTVFGAAALAFLIRGNNANIGEQNTATAAAALPFSALFDNKQEIYIVTSDTAFLQISELSGHRLTLNDYLMRSYPEGSRALPSDLIQLLNRAQFTDATETAIAGLIMRRNAKFLQRSYLRSGRQLGLADLKTHNIVVLGSPISNPWADLYADQLNFEFELDKGLIRFRNRSPHPGEAPVYPAAGDAELNHAYAQLVFLPSTSPDGGNVLLLAGTTAESTAAAGEFLLSESDLPKALKVMGIDPSGPPKYFEILLRASTFMGGATRSEPIAYRLHPYSSR
jgi:hypothetical protein